MMILAPLRGYQYIRPMCQDDMKFLMHWNTDPEMQELAGQKFAVGNEVLWWQEMVRDRHRTAFAILTEEARVIGDVELEHITWRAKEAEIRIAIGDRNLWDRGYGTGALKDALDVAFSRLGLFSIYLRVAQTNRRAIRVYQKTGFRKTGLLPANGRLEGNSDLLLMTIVADRFYRPKASALTADSVSTA